MQTTRSFKRLQKLFLTVLLVTLAIAGCAGKMVMNLDGMPISQNEYILQNPETGIRISYVLARYYRQYEGKEYMVLPEYLDVEEQNRIDAKRTERLLLHLKVVNLQRQLYSLYWGVSGKEIQSNGLLYSGHLSRKDFYVNLPLGYNGDYKYHVQLYSSDDEPIFHLERFQYTVKGGVKKKY